MTDPVKHTAEIERLDSRRIRGERARQRLDDLGELFANRQAEYISVLVGNTKSRGKVDKETVHMLVALQDLVDDLESDIDGGRKASRKLDDLKTQAGVDDDG